MEVEVLILIACLIVAVANLSMHIQKFYVESTDSTLGSGFLRFYAIPALVSDETVNLTEVEPQFLGWRDTTNPYKDWLGGDPINELTVDESLWAGKKLDAVLALDEEAITKWGIDYAVRTIERADEALIYKLGVDLKIKQVVAYESDDSIEWMNPEYRDVYAPGAPTLYEEAFELFKSYFDGTTEIIIVITGQETIDSFIAGLAPENPRLGINTMVMARFQAYWADDNMIQHELSHCLGCDDHPEEVDVWCIMAYRAELIYIDWIVEDGRWYGPYNCYVPRAYLTYDYCSECYQRLTYRYGYGSGYSVRLDPLGVVN
ncbi:MAG: hypothetical protein QXJ07_06175 [Candidatus Bathyarchaeia archaeon]